MSELYNRLSGLCEERGITGYRMCKDCGLSPSTMTDLKSGRKKTLNAESADRVAGYFGVSVSYILGTETEKAPAGEGERAVTEDDIKAAFWGGEDDLPEEAIAELWEDAKSYIAFKTEQMRKKRRK